MSKVAARFPADDTIVAALRRKRDGHPAVGLLGSRAAPRPRAAAPRSSPALETVLKRNPAHAGAIHLYIHAVEASTAPEQALPHADRAGRARCPARGPHRAHAGAHLLPGGHVPATRSIEPARGRGRRALLPELALGPALQERRYPHNIHFVMVSAQMAATARPRSRRGDEARRGGARGASPSSSRSWSR